MLTQQFTLPEWDFVGGETQKRSFDLQKSNGKFYDIPNGTARLTVVEFTNSDTAPVLQKETPVTANADGKACVVTFSLAASDTLTMAGKYIYQVTVKDGNGNAKHSQGRMIVTRNIDKGFLT